MFWSGGVTKVIFLSNLTKGGVEVLLGLSWGCDDSPLLHFEDLLTRPILQLEWSSQYIPEDLPPSVVELVVFGNLPWIELFLSLLRIHCKYRRVILHWLSAGDNLPAKNTENEIHHKKGPQHNHGYKVNKLPRISLGVVDLWNIRLKYWNIFKLRNWHRKFSLKVNDQICFPTKLCLLSWKIIYS